MLRAAIALTLFLVAFGLSGLAIYESSAYQQCSAEAGAQSSTEHQGQEKVIPLIQHGRIVFRCAGQSIAENNAVVSAVATVAIAVFTTILGLFTMSLARSTRIAAAAAKDSADIAEAALVKLERAFVAPGAFDFYLFISHTGMGYDFILPWLNSGSTAARKFIAYIKWDAFLGDIPANYTFQSARDTGTYPVYIAPKETTKSGPLQVNVETLEAVRVQHIRLFFYGVGTYFDIFDGTPQHITKFCTELFRIDGDPYQIGGQLICHFRSYPRHNCIDEDCKDNQSAGLSKPS